MKMEQGRGSHNARSVATKAEISILIFTFFLLRLGHGGLDVRSAILLRIAVGFIRYYVAFLPQRTWKQQIGEML
ncbi:hypothetical protein J3E68DRAFT_388631 [Trichoderma sp. SZMC 28012]